MDKILRRFDAFKRAAPEDSILLSAKRLNKRAQENIQQLYIFL